MDKERENLEDALKVNLEATEGALEAAFSWREKYPHVIRLTELNMQLRDLTGRTVKISDEDVFSLDVPAGDP